MNMKIIYMPILKDDLFIVYCAIINITFSIIGALFWGYIADQRGFTYALIVLTFLDCVVKIFGMFAMSKMSVMILFVGLGFVDKAMITISGPGMVKIFGLETATKLLPFKGVSVLLSYIIAPLGYILLNHKLS